VYRRLVERSVRVSGAAAACVVVANRCQRPMFRSWTVGTTAGSGGSS